MSQLLGVMPTETHTTAQFEVGTRVFIDADQKEYVYVQAGSAITAAFPVVLSASNVANQITSTNGLYGLLVGVPEVAIANNAFGWVQVAGACNMQVLASCAANVRLNTTATAGNLDDDGSAGTKVVLGAALTSARAASAGTAPAILSYPQVGATL